MDKYYKHPKDRDTKVKELTQSKNGLNNRLAYRFWWGWSIQLKPSFET